MTRTTKTAAAAARACGMSKTKWSAVKTQAYNARTRGRRGQADNTLATWGEVDGQEALFTTDETD